MLSQYLPLFFRAVDIFADLCDDNHHEGQIKREYIYDSESCFELLKLMQCKKYPKIIPVFILVFNKKSRTYHMLYSENLQKSIYSV